MLNVFSCVTIFPLWAVNLGVCTLISTDVWTSQFCYWFLASLQRRLLVGYISFRIYWGFLVTHIGVTGQILLHIYSIAFFRFLWGCIFHPKWKPCTVNLYQSNFKYIQNPSPCYPWVVHCTDQPGLAEGYVVYSSLPYSVSCSKARGEFCTKHLCGVGCSSLPSERLRFTDFTGQLDSETA